MYEANTYRRLISCRTFAVLLAMFVAPIMAAGTVTWDGGGGDSDWFNSNNWDTAQVPADGDEVVIGGSASVVLSNSTANLSSFMITNATLTFTNWTTALNATNVTIENAGKLQHKACDTNAVPSNTNRVYVVCSNLTIEAGGSINADYLGYRGATGAVASWGQGPGAGYYRGGGGYGGKGGIYTSADTAGPTYGSSNAPVQPGSGGGNYITTRPGMAGGGVVRIDASCRVTVNGTITARGYYNINDWGGSGSGGAIYITCQTFAATNGVIQAYGGYTQNYSGSAGSGGGGRIAVDYNVAAQSALNLTDKPSVVFKVGQGTGYHPGDPGTLYLTDASFYPSAPVLHGGELVIPGFSSWAPESLTITNGQTVFPSGFQLTVTSNLTVTGKGGGIRLTDSKVTVGGDFIIDSAWTNSGRSYLSGGTSSESVVSGHVIIDDGYLSFSSAGTNTHDLHVGGDLILTNAGRFYVTAGLTNASTPDYGALISVTGDVFIGYSSWIYPYSDKTNGGSLLFRMRNLTIVTNSGFNADSKGFDGGPATGRWGYGPGGGYNTGGGGYGGKGAPGSPYSPGTSGGPTCGSSNAPVDPGSGGGTEQSSLHLGTRAGGSVRIEAARKVTVNGTITATGGSNAGSGSHGGSGSGGGIYIRCRTFAGESTGILRANGGNSRDISGYGGSGGGGRIAVWRTYHTYEGTTSVTNGSGYYSASDPGTVVWGYIPPSGTFIHIR